LGFFPHICKMRLLRRDLSCLLKVFYCFKGLFYSANNDIFFVLHSMEEGDAMGGVAYCAPNIWESIRRGVSVLATGPNCKDGQGMSYLKLGLYVWPLVGADWVKFVLAPFFFPHIKRVVGSIRVFDYDFGIRGRSSVPSWGCRLLVRLRSGVTVLV